MLIALAHTLGVFNGATDKAGLIKTFRRLWSEGESNNREMIVAFFKHEGRMYPNPKPREKPHEREEKIDELLETFELSDEERRDLHAAFIDIRTRKITPEKIAAKLEHIRYTRKREALEKALDGKFDYDDTLEYYSPITYNVGGESFTKIHLLKTPPLNEKRLHEETTDVLVSEITALKSALTDQKQEQTNTFLESLNLNSHRYLTREQIIASLKSAPPSTQTFGVLSIEIVRDVLARHLRAPLTSVGSDDLVIEIDKSLSLPYRNTPLEYTLALHLDAHELSRQIWSEEELTIASMIEGQSAHEERAFLSELEHLVDECREHSKLLNIDNVHLYGIVYELLLPYLTRAPHISSKTYRRVLFAFDQRIADELLKRQRQA
ncbi:MAG: helicase, partial [Sulfuricurvum sp.]|nr:helicase [Sulfuricurvum sp.]